MALDNDPGLFVPLKPQRLSEEIYRQLKEAIFSGHYKPGDKFPSEKMFCEAFRVGRPVIREALRRLENSGLISVRPGAGGGAFVQRIDSSILAATFEGIVKVENISMKELIEARVATELAALPLIFERMDQADFDALEENFAEVQETLNRGIRGKKNLAFHVLLIRASHNQLLTKIGEAMLDLMGKLLERYEYEPARSRAMLKEHRKLINLLKAREYGVIPDFLRKHIIDSVNFGRYEQEAARGGQDGEAQ